jgi:hypothetical protein
MHLDHEAAPARRRVRETAVSEGRALSDHTVTRIGGPEQDLGSRDWIFVPHRNDPPEKAEGSLGGLLVKSCYLRTLDFDLVWVFFVLYLGEGLKAGTASAIGTGGGWLAHGVRGKNPGLLIQNE